MKKQNGLKKSSRVLVAVAVTLAVMGTLFIFREYLAKNFGIEADTTKNEKLLFKKTVDRNDFSTDTYSQTLIFSSTKISLSSNATQGKISGSVALPKVATISKIVVGAQEVNNTCTKINITAAFSQDKSAYSDNYISNNSISLLTSDVRARYIKYAIELIGCDSRTISPSIDSLSVLGYTDNDVSNPPTPPEPGSTASNPPTPPEPVSSVTPPVPANPTETATITSTPAATTTTVASNQIFGNPQDSAKTVALSGIQSGVSFWSLIILVGAIGTLVVIRIIKSED